MQHYLTHIFRFLEDGTCFYDINQYEQRAIRKFASLRLRGCPVDAAVKTRVETALARVTLFDDNGYRYPTVTTKVLEYCARWYETTEVESDGEQSDDEV